MGSFTLHQEHFLEGNSSSAQDAGEFEGIDLLLPQRSVAAITVFALSLLLRNGIHKMNVTSGETRAQGGETCSVDTG